MEIKVVKGKDGLLHLSEDYKKKKTLCGIETKEITRKPLVHFNNSANRCRICKDLYWEATTTWDGI